MNYNEAMQYIESLGKFGIHLGMERITGLVELLDHPERKIRTIHITGTNGKGSVASYLSHILTASGKKTACYTSPHFVKYNERMSIDGVDISDEDFAAVTEETKAAVDTFLKNGGEQPTQFEVITAMAFLYFAKERWIMPSSKSAWAAFGIRRTSLCQSFPSLRTLPWSIRTGWERPLKPLRNKRPASSRITFLL